MRVLPGPASGLGVGLPLSAPGEAGGASRTSVELHPVQPQSVTWISGSSRNTPRAPSAAPIRSNEPVVRDRDSGRTRRPSASATRQTAR